MVKLIGPLNAETASGTLAGTIVYSTSRSRNYARSHVVPVDPRTAAQTRNRLMIKFISQAWSAIPTEEKLSWVNHAQTLGLSPYHAYNKLNLDRFTQFRTPTMAYPALEESFNERHQQHKAVGGKNIVTIELNRHPSICPWGFCVFRAPNVAYTPSLGTLVLVVPSPGPVQFFVVEENVPAGYWRHMQFQFFSDGFRVFNTRNSKCTVTD